MYWTCNSMNNMSSYCGLVDTRISASDKYLPVQNGGSDPTPRTLTLASMQTFCRVDLFYSFCSTNRSRSTQEIILSIKYLHSRNLLRYQKIANPAARIIKVYSTYSDLGKSQFLGSAKLASWNNLDFASLT